MLRVALLLLSLFTCSACSAVPTPAPGPGPAPAPVFPDWRIVVGINGEADLAAYAGDVPLLTFVRAKGKGSATIRPRPPFVTFAGDLVVEPLPGREARVARAMATGALVVPGGLRPAGTIDSMAFPPPPPPPFVFPPTTPAPPTQDGGAGVP